MRTFFHLTPVSQLEAILRDGLDPVRSASSLPAIFLAGSVGTAENYAGTKDELCAMLRVDLPAHLLEHLQPDNVELRDLIADLSEEDLEGHGLWEGAAWSDCTWQQSLAICDQVACCARIPSECLRQINPTLAQAHPMHGAVEMAMQNPAFQDWFKASQVVDDHGLPLMVFHGTFDDFCAFEQSEDGGFHFGSESAAGRRLADLAGDEGAEGARVMPLFLSIQNPKTLLEDPGTTDPWKNAIALAVKEGHDGIRYPNSAEFDEDMDGNPIVTESWVAFEPGQIKSAIANSGAYDRLDPDTTDRRANAAKALEWLQGFGKKAAPHA